MMKNIWSSCWKCGRRFTRRILGFCLILCAVLVSASEENSVNTDPVKDNSKILNRQNGGKLFIELGWDIPDTSFLRSNYVEMESAAPFDGVIYRLSGKDEEGGIHHTEWAWDKSKWKWEWFIPAVEDLKSCRFQKFHHNFIRFNASPGNLNWDDDEGWSALADKVGIAARVAFQTGGRGIAPDFESYGEKQFCWKPERGLSFAETCKLARKQGARFMKAIASEYPSAVVMPLWMNSINFQIGELCAGKSLQRAPKPHRLRRAQSARPFCRDRSHQFRTGIERVLPRRDRRELSGAIPVYLQGRRAAQRARDTSHQGRCVPLCSGLPREIRFHLRRPALRPAPLCRGGAHGAASRLAQPGRDFRTRTLQTLRFLIAAGV